MAITFQHKGGRGIKVFINSDHMKTIPRKLLEPFKEHHGKINFDKKKRLTAEERKILHGFMLYASWVNKLKTTDKHAYELIKDHYPIDTRKVINEQAIRYELVLDNQIKIKSPEKIYIAFKTKENIVYSNY
ncbi:hypothetical protein DNC80_14275 [Flavobacterium sp. SOK18b]|uniref:hypothetical protein n=1 Tax=Flavobacterium sp. SOK18b TaxID=797900 RepID=UPI0015F8AA60|nr:hypothetical protein [Flavobacterium sp. SOK18b]MBB1194833.1 hypothetical protein [Flavobacterium sp. SOK18b]